MQIYLIQYILHLADDSLILGHRNSEWCGHGPVLEQDIAITNISLDLIGQARNFYQYAAQLKADHSTEDTLSFLRPKSEFKNCLLVEQPNGDWAQTIVRQFLFSTYQYLLYEKLQYSSDEQLAAIAGKSLKEVTYHLRWSSEWIIRLGDGTTHSNQRMLHAIDQLWMYTQELFTTTDYEIWAMKNKVGADLTLIKLRWEQKVKEIFNEATLAYPEKVFSPTQGKQGNHTKNLDNILSELQFMQKTYPNSEW